MLYAKLLKVKNANFGENTEIVCLAGSLCVTVDIHQLSRSAKPALLPQGRASAMSQPVLSQAKKVSMSPKLMRASVGQ